MKLKNSIIFLFVTFVGVSSVTAQEKERTQGRKNIIKINPLLFGHYQVYYERILNKHNSISFSGAFGETTDFLHKSINNKSTSEEIETKNWKLYAEHRYYFKNAPTSYFLGTFVRYTTGNEDVKAKTETQNYDHTRTINNIALGVVFGRQYDLGNNFTLDWFLGGMGEYVSRTNLKFSDISNNKADYEKNILDGKKINRLRPNVRLGLSLGYRF